MPASTETLREREYSGDPPSHKRASAACVRCRSRKVRCSLNATGNPCENCSLDQAQCVVEISKRSREYRAEKARLTQAANVRPENASRSQNPKQQWAVPQLSTVGDTSAPVRVLSALRRNSPDYPRPHTTMLSPSSPLLSLGTASQHRTAHRENGPFSDLPNFIARPQHEFQSEDLRYLQDSGALKIPDTRLRDQLLLSFVLHVDPHFPVVEIQTLLDAVEQRSEIPFSLLLFHAVMFAGSHFVDMDFLHEAGFETRVAASTCYYRRIKVLRDAGWESDRLAVLQATLLHQWWWTSSSDLQDPWYWLGICVSLATGIGMNHPSTLAVKDGKTQKLWRRIWWVCIARDRMLGLIHRKKMRIRDEDIALPALRFQDFDTNPLYTKIPALAGSFPVTDCVNKVLQADLFISQARLLLSIGRILECSYNLQGFVNSTSAWSLFYTPKKREELDQDRLGHLLKELNTWSGQLNKNCSMGVPDDSTTDDILADHVHASRAALRLLYLLAQELFHRPLAFMVHRDQWPVPDREQWPIPPADSSEDSSTAAARLRASEAAAEIAEILTKLHHRGKLLLLPPWIITCVMTAVAWFLIEMRSAQKSPADLPGHKYHQCIRAFSKIKDNYPIWDEAFILLKGMAINQHAWFARTLAMVSPSVPMISTPKSGTNSTTKSRPRAQITSPPTNSSPVASQMANDMNIAFGIQDGLHQTHRDQQQTDHYLSSAPMFMTSMHPFPLAAPAFTSFDAMGYDEFSMGQALDAYGLGDSITGRISDFSPTFGQEIEGSSSIPTALMESVAMEQPYGV